MADNIDLSKLDLTNIEQAIKEIATAQGRSTDKIVISKGSIKDLAKEIADNTWKSLPKQSKILSSDIGKQIQQAVLQQKAESASLMGKLSRPGWWLGQDTTGSGLQMMRRAEMMGSGVEQIFKGNVLGGLRQFGAAIPSVARLMSGPLAIGIQAVITGLSEFDKHLTAVNRSVYAQTGGVISPYLNASAADKQRFLNQSRQPIRNLNMMAQEQEILGSFISNFTISQRLNRQEDLIKGISYNRAAMQSLGVDSSTADRLSTGLMRREGLNANQSSAFISRMLMRLEKMGNNLVLPEKQIIEETVKGYDANKKFNLSMGWINNQIIKFNRSLENGTRSFEDFASVQKSLYNGETGQLAGLANIIAESAGMAGVEVPQELIQNLNNPYALKMLMSDPEIMKKLGPGLQATAKRFASESGNAGNILAEQGFLGDMLHQLFKMNVSRQGIIDLQTSGYDFAKSGLLGTGSSASISKRLQDQKNIDEEAGEFQGKVLQYQKDVTTLLGRLSNTLGELKDGALLSLKEGVTTQTKTQQILEEASKSDKNSAMDNFFINIAKNSTMGPKY